MSEKFELKKTELEFQSEEILEPEGDSKPDDTKADDTSKPELVISRREFLAYSGALGFIGVSAVIVNKIMDLRAKEALQQIIATYDRTKSQIDTLKDEEAEFQPINIKSVVPEHSRSASHVLVSLPYYQPIMGGGYGSTRDFYEDNFAPMLQALPDYATVHLIAPENFGQTEEEYVRKRIEPRTLKVYPVFSGSDASMYVQDAGESLGSLSESGQFQLVSSRGEMDVLKNQGICITPFDRMSEKERRLSVNPSYMDNLLAKRYPDMFSSRYIDANFIGGNLTFGSLPNGETCVFVSKSDLATYVMCTMGIDGRRVLSKRDYFTAKDRYEKALGTKNIIVIDEEDFLTRMQTRPLLEAAAPEPFFHNDMIFSQYNVSGDPVIALSSLRISRMQANGYGYNDEVARPIDEFLYRVGRQLNDLGYKIVEIPFFTPDLNFINGISYTDRTSGKPTVILPYYDFDRENDRRPRYLDEHMMNEALLRMFESAEDRYEDAGITVIAAPYKQNSDVTRTHIERKGGLLNRESSIMGQSLGGFHCRSMVLM